MNITNAITHHAEERPDTPAVVTLAQTLTYRALDDMVWNGCAWLARQGIAPGDRVGVAIEPSLPHLAVSLALARQGASQITLAARESPVSRREALKRLHVAAVIGGADAAELGAARLVPDLDEWLRPASQRKSGVQRGKLPWLITESSGTTGTPKAFALTHRDTFYRARRDRTMLRCDSGERFMTLAAIQFSVGKQRIMHCLDEGGTVCFAEGASADCGPLEILRRMRISYLAGTAMHAAKIAGNQAAGRDGGLPDVRVFRLGASTIEESLRARVRKQLTPKLYINYGVSEVGTVCLATPEDQLRLPGTVGRPLQGLEVAIVDAQGRNVAHDAIGQIRVRGPGVVTGYLDGADAQAGNFRGGWFYPGDLACHGPDGLLTLHGRTDELIIFDGINIYPAEIERALLAHPAIAEAAAFPIASEIHGEIPAAAIVLRSAVAPGALERHCKEWLGAKAPSRLIVARALPRNAMGKVLRRELPALLRDAGRGTG